MSSTPTLRQRLDQARMSRFTGRDDEIRRFQALLQPANAQTAVLYLHGPGGVGKSSLLDQFARLAMDVGTPVHRRDARDVQASPEGVRGALTSVQSSGFAAADTGRSVLMIDTYERLASIDDWMRDSLIPDLPDGVLVVLAGRNQPAAGWRADSGWAALTEVMSLRNFRPDEAERFLLMRGIDADRWAELVSVSYGHPLALSLLADLERGREHGAPVSFRNQPDLVRVLLERFVSNIPPSLERSALEICAHTRVTTEALLREALDLDDASALFAWLRDLSFIQGGPFGLFPHDLARDVLDADFRWRDLKRYTEMHDRVRRPIVRRIRELRGLEQQQAATDLLYLHRNGPVMGNVHHWVTLGTGREEPATDQDLPGILAIVERFEGPESAAIIRYWYERNPGFLGAYRSLSCNLLGFGLTLRLEQPEEVDAAADPAIAAMWGLVDRRSPLRPGEAVLYHRSFMDAEAYQSTSPSLNLAAMRSALDWVINDSLGWSFMSVHNLDFWQPVFEYLDLTHFEEAGFTVGGRRYAVFGHNWRAKPVSDWLRLMGEREIASAPPPPPSIDDAQVTVLSRPDFDQAVRQALKDFHRPDVLRENPLLRSGMVLDRGGADRIESLRLLLRDATTALEDSPRDVKLYRAIYHTYLHPAGSQERAAELLDLPFNTYRYHLSGALRRITDHLWSLELGR